MCILYYPTLHIGVKWSQTWWVVLWKDLRGWLNPTLVEGQKVISWIQICNIYNVWPCSSHSEHSNLRGHEVKARHCEQWQWLWVGWCVRVFPMNMAKVESDRCIFFQNIKNLSCNRADIYFTFYSPSLLIRGQEGREGTDSGQFLRLDIFV